MVAKPLLPFVERQEGNFLASLLALDALLSGRINRLLTEGQITNIMATSLINDSEQAGRIMRDLIDIATLLYYPRDRLVSEMEEEKPVAA